MKGVKMMDAQVAFSHEVEDADSYALEDLANGLFNSGFTPNTIKSDHKNNRLDGGLSIALSVAGLAISALGTFLSVLSYWKMKWPKYKITFRQDDISMAIENFSASQQISLITDLTKQESSADIKITISRN